MVSSLESMGKDYGITFTPQELNKFKLLQTFGVPISKMKGFLALSTTEQDKVLKDMGIPCDSTDNQFKAWVRSARASNADLRIAIKADQNTPYSVVWQAAAAQEIWFGRSFSDRQVAQVAAKM